MACSTSRDMQDRPDTRGVMSGLGSIPVILNKLEVIMEEKREKIYNLNTWEGRHDLLDDLDCVALKRGPGRPKKEKQPIPAKLFEFPLNDRPPKICGACGYTKDISQWTELGISGNVAPVKMYVLNPGTKVDISHSAILYACPICQTVTWSV